MCLLAVDTDREIWEEMWSDFFFLSKVTSLQSTAQEFPSVKCVEKVAYVLNDVMTVM